MRAVGSSIPRFDARSKVTGEMPYPGDFNLPGQLHMKILWPDRPHARITKFDAAAALAAPGVVAVFGADDVPVNEYGLIMPDQEVLVGRVGGIVRCLLDQVALVVAETEAQAEAALKLIDIEYEDLPSVYSVEEAMAPDAPIVHPEKGDSNVLLHYKIRHGDVDAAFAEADVIVEGEYSTHPQEHAYLQPEAGVAHVRPDGKVEVIVGGQWMHEDRQQVAHSLGLPDEQVVVVYPGIGGAFGGREDMSIQIVLALAAWKLGRPGQNAMDARRIDYRTSQTPCQCRPRQMGGDERWPDHGHADRCQHRLWGLCLHLDQGPGQSHPGLRRPLRHPQRLCRCPHRLHQQHRRWRISGIWRTTGPLDRRNADESPG